MRTKSEIIKDANTIITEYENVVTGKGKESYRTCLKRAYDSYYLLKEFTELLEKE